MVTLRVSFGTWCVGLTWFRKAEGVRDDWTNKGYQDFTHIDVHMEFTTIRYRREVWLTPESDCHCAVACSCKGTFRREIRHLFSKSKNLMGCPATIESSQVGCQIQRFKAMIAKFIKVRFVKSNQCQYLIGKKGQAVTIIS